MNRSNPTRCWYDRALTEAIVEVCAWRNYNSWTWVNLDGTVVYWT